MDKNCGVVDGSSSDYDADRSQWRIISYQQIYDLQSERLSYKKSLDLSFKLMCPGFNRDNRQLEQWVTERYDTGTDAGTGIRFGLEKYYKTSTKGNYDDNLLTEDYVFPDGSSDESSRTYTKGDINSYRTYLGKYFCADIKKARGAIYQVVHVDHGGSYVIECKAFSTTRKARLFAALLKDNTKGTTDYTIDPNTVHETVIMQTENMSNDEQTKLHIAEENMDYAGKEFYGSHKYFNSVLVQVRVPNDGTGANIVFGVRVGKKDEATVESDDEWTVFDDFRLLYAGSDIDHDLILDEDKDNLNYLKTCSQNYEDVILHLNKSSFKKNLKKWNTITLPVNLTKDQFTQAFGSNARLARLTALTKDEIQFTTEKIANLGDDDIALSAYVPYIIYPTKDLVSEWNPSYTALLSETGTGTEVKEHRVTIARDHIDIPNVSFAKKDVNVNDLDKMNTNTWVSNLTDVAKKSDDCPIITDGTLAAYGTFARTYGSIMDNDVQTTFTVDKTNPIISGRDDLRGCYFFHEGKLIFAGSNVRGLRGFSVWFKPIKNATESNQARFSLDGIDYTTDIDRVFAADNDPSLTQFAKRGIYNVNGQLVRKGSSDTQGLPSGIYIVNGKKVLVK